MIKYYKQIQDNILIAIGTNIGGIEIAKEEYDRIMSIIQNKQEDTEDYYYILNATTLEYEK